MTTIDTAAQTTIDTAAHAAAETVTKVADTAAHAAAETVTKVADKPLGRYISRMGMKVRKYSPEILTTVGVVGVVTSTVMACRATLKVEDILDTLDARKEDLRKVNEHAEKNPEFEQAHRATNAAIHIKAGLDLAKLYGPSITVGLASIACLLGAHGIMRKRNAALAVAYNSVEKTFAEYRRRVEEKIGKDEERDLRYGVDETTVENEDGEKETKYTFNTKGLSQYARVFDETNHQWKKDPYQNKMFLMSQQNFANDMLRARGHVFLNEVYDLLGFDRTPEGAATGWIYKDGQGDDFIDFGIYDLSRDSAREFIEGHEAAVWLDFNVQGSIWDRI